MNTALLIILALFILAALYVTLYVRRLPVERGPIDREELRGK